MMNYSYVIKKNNAIKFLSTLFILLFSLFSFSQESSFSIADSLKNNKCSEFITKFNKSHNKENSIRYAKKVDSCFEANKLPSAEIKRAYEILIENCKEEKNTEKQLLYTKKLLLVDSLLQDDKKVLNAANNKEFEIAKLIKQREKIISKLNEAKKRSYLGLIILSILLLLAAILIWFYYRRQKQYKNRFEKLIFTDKSDETENKPQENKPINIDENIQKKILDALYVFEENEEFIKPKITLSSLAKNIETNPKYLSLIVNEYKNKSFSNYMNDLRINHAITRLKSDETFRKYTIKAIASDVGFSNVKSFSNAFYKQAGIYPSYFIKKINESN